MSVKKVFLSFFLCCSLAVAQPPADKHLPPIDFTRVLNGLDGKPLQSEQKEKLTLSDVAVNALLATLDEDRQLAGTEKVKRYELARKIYGQKEVSLTPEELVMIRERIGKAYGPVVVGVAWRFLE